MRKSIKILSYYKVQYYIINIKKNEYMFLIVKTISDIDFKFIVNSKKYYSIFKIKLDNKSIITVKGYNEISDFCYKKLIKNNNISLYGELNSKGEIEILEIYLL